MLKSPRYTGIAYSAVNLQLDLKPAMYEERTALEPSPRGSVLTMLEENRASGPVCHCPVAVSLNPCVEKNPGRYPYTYP